MDNFLSFASLRNYAVTLIIFLTIDMVWLVFIAKSIYAKYLGYLMSEKVNFGAAFLFYAIFILGLMFFVINPALDKGGVKYAIFAGALFGLVTYSTYDLTNMATIKDWPTFITVIDLIWGSFVSSATATLAYLAIRALSGNN
jgi:uncharacterized membrane protein